MTPTEAIKETVDKWWNTWHRFAEEEDLPPDNIIALLETLKKENIEFDHMTGLWKGNK